MRSPEPEDSSASAWPRPVPTPFEWAVLAVGLLLVNHYAWILDDAYVYFRYVDNLVDFGWGLVYNQGEYVEGFTGALWLVTLTLARQLPLDYWLIVRAFGALYFVLFWWLLVVLDRRTSPRDGPALNFPLVYLCLNYAVLCYFTSGVESPLVQVTAIAYALVLLGSRAWVPTVLVAVSPLTRPELALAFALLLVFCLVRDRAIPWRLGLLGAAVTGAWVLFRIYYYADLVPNTFYLKDLADFGQGLYYLHETLSVYWGYVVFPAFALLAFALHRRGALRDGLPRLAMLGIAFAIAAYFVRVGGDPRHYRYLAFSFCLVVAATSGLLSAAVQSFALRVPRPAAVAAGVVLGLLVFSMYPPQLSRHPSRSGVKHRMVHEINDAAYHRLRPDLAPSPWSLEKIDNPLRLNGEVHDPADGYLGVSQTSWCRWAYRIIRLRVVHKAGLTDAILARVDVPPDRPAHKPDLFPMADDMVVLYERYGPRRGMFRQAIEDGIAADWMVRNLDTIEIIERKIFNQHRFGENLGLAFSFPPRLDP